METIMKKKSSRQTSRSSGSRRFLTAIAAVLVFCLMTANLMVMPVAASDNYVDGDWDTKESQVAGNSGYAYVLEEPIEDCEELTVELLVEMNNGAKCKDWTVYAKGTSGSFKAIGNIHLDDGDGEGAAEISLKKPMTIEKLLVVPKINGSYSWSMAMAVSSPQAEGGYSSDDEEEEGEYEYCMLDGEWDPKESKVGNTTTYAFTLSEPVEDCEELAVEVEIEMSNGAKCKDWTVYAKGTSGAFKAIGNLHLDDGDGEGSAEFTLKQPMTIEKVAIVPKVNGSYSWEMGMAVYAMVPSDGEGYDEDEEEGDYEYSMLDGDWDAKESKVGNTTAYAFTLSEPLEDCEELGIEVMIEMSNGAKCKDWTVYAKGTSGAFKAIGNLHLDDGDGEGSAEISLKKPMTIEKVAIVPKVNGSYSWEMAMAVYG